ncbi:MAG: M23 family metallopeptidase [Streptomyces sp.]|uniref:M23 family metallopeptidase n=1 Tax=Streptomyces sp. TaxID=1931 RepID=UPI003D6C0880
MAFTHATGKHRRPRRASRRRAQVAGIAGLAAAGVVGSLATPAVADSGTQSTSHETGLTRAVGFGDSLADTVSEQARTQQAEAEQAKAEAIAKKKAAEAKRKAAAEKAKREREAKEKAARAAARAKLLAYGAPLEDASVSTSYQSSGGLWSSGGHTGIDFQAAEGTAVKSVAAGEVVEAGFDGSFGNNIVIKHRDGKYTQYAHLSSISVSAGQSVTSGQQIGLSGSTGNTTGPHLHFEARSGPDYGSDMDPVGYLREHGVGL